MPPQANLHTLHNVMKDNILCYISSARHSISREQIIKNTCAFYEQKDILKSKRDLFELCKEHPIKRNSCQSHPNPIIADIADIYDLFGKVDEKNIGIPEFLASSYSAFPPSNFESIADILCSVRDETTALRMEIIQMRENSSKDSKAMEDICTVKQDILDIKTKIFSLPCQDAPSIPIEPNALIPNNVSSDQRSYSSVLAESVRSVDQNEARNLSSQNVQQNNLAPSSNNTEAPWIMVGQAQRSNRANILQPNHNRRRTNSTGQPRNRRRNENIIGTRQSEAGSLSGVERVMAIFLGGCPKSTSCADVSNYCESTGLSIKKVDLIPTKSEWHQPFKISVGAAERDKLLDPENWPKDCFVRKFFKGRTTVIDQLQQV